jgi:hypothetical protein
LINEYIYEVQNINFSEKHNARNAVEKYSSIMIALAGILHVLCVGTTGIYCIRVLPKSLVNCRLKNVNPSYNILPY